MVDYKRYEEPTGNENVRITRTGLVLKRGRRFTNEEFRKLTGLDMIYKDHKDKKIIYRAVTEILKIYMAQDWLHIVTPDEETTKKSRGRPQTVYECLKELDLSAFPFIKDVKERYKCHYCNKDIPLDSKPKYCPFCGKLAG